MEPIATRCTNVALEAAGYHGLPAQRCHAVIDDARPAEEGGIVAAIRTVWRLSEQERQRVAGGADIELILLGERHPPVLLKTTADPESAIWEDRP